uniref:Uncharacterized protein n=1 Tax=Oryza punctata TaxID=4537 RepID=A0A0E0LC54_ORYPU
MRQCQAHRGRVPSTAPSPPSTSPAAEKKDAADGQRAVFLLISFPFHSLLTMPQSTGTLPCRDLVAVPVVLDQARLIRRANIFPSRSSPNSLNNPQDPSTEERDQALLLQLWPPSSIFDFSLSEPFSIAGVRSRRRAVPPVAAIIQASPGLAHSLFAEIRGRSPPRRCPFPENEDLV